MTWQIDLSFCSIDLEAVIFSSYTLPCLRFCPTIPSERVSFSLCFAFYIWTAYCAFSLNILFHYLCEDRIIMFIFPLCFPVVPVSPGFYRDSYILWEKDLDFTFSLNLYEGLWSQFKNSHIPLNNQNSVRELFCDFCLRGNIY